MISFMGVEYRKVSPDGTIKDIIGIFEKDTLKKTTKVDSAKEFIEHSEKKRPRTVKGALRLISQFNKRTLDS